jgi:hypothetical protein
MEKHTFKYLFELKRIKMAVKSILEWVHSDSYVSKPVRCGQKRICRRVGSNFRTPKRLKINV